MVGLVVVPIQWRVKVQGSLPPLAFAQKHTKKDSIQVDNYEIKQAFSISSIYIPRSHTYPTHIRTIGPKQDPLFDMWPKENNLLFSVYENVILVKSLSNSSIIQNPTKEQVFLRVKLLFCISTIAKWWTSKWMKDFTFFNILSFNPTICKKNLWNRLIKQEEASDQWTHMWAAILTFPAALCNYPALKELPHKSCCYEAFWFTYKLKKISAERK